jgi:hypothetical protein
MLEGDGLENKSKDNHRYSPWMMIIKRWRNRGGKENG